MSATHGGETGMHERSTGVGGAPLTKFRVPRLRADAVPRAAPLARLVHAVDSSPLTLLCAPGGAGKTTLLAQWAASVAAHAAIAWITLDEDDDDANRLFATLVQAVEPLGLAWDVEPRVVAAGVAGSGTQTRAAVAALVNALCTSQAPRVVIVLDDLHRVRGTDSMALLEALVERLPDHVALLLGTRVEPALPLARWRAYGELVDLGPEALRFELDDALALAAARAGATPEQAGVRAALERTQGWAAGLGMLLQSRQRSAERVPLGGGTESANRQLYAYLAQEIFRELPDDLQDFALRTSILAELSPAPCRALTGREDAAAVLDALYRRNLFLTVLDETTPVLRFHDLFREFLEAELARRLPAELASLHERAAASEPVPARAVHHWLRAGRWAEAMRLILVLGEKLLVQGAVATVDRWLDQVPEAVRAAEPHAAYLRGTCAWLRWDWARARPELSRAVAGLTEPAELPQRIRASFQLVDALNSSGDSEAAWERLEQVGALPLDAVGRAELALQRSWCVAPAGRPDEVAALLREFVALAAREPARVCPPTAPRIHCTLVGLRGVADAFEQFGTLARGVFGAKPSPWHIAALAVHGWGQLWHGEREAAGATLERAIELDHQFGHIRLLAERIAPLRAFHAAVTGEVSTALALAQRHVDGLANSPELSWHAAVWLRAYRHGQARMLWIAGEERAWREAAKALVAPRTRAEWPFVDVAADLVRGQEALLRGDHESAIAALTRAVAQHDRLRMPQIYGDPRVLLAWAWLRAGDPARAWQAFEPAWAEVLHERAYGLLLLERREQVEALVDLVPAGARGPGFATAHAVLEAWRPTAATRERAAVSLDAARATADTMHTAANDPALHERPTGVAHAARSANPGPQAGPLAVLTDRELEVLAQVAAGASNKHVARDLDLSLHTVKRHVANILDKLDCASRGQAADLYRRHEGSLARA